MKSKRKLPETPIYHDTNVRNRASIVRHGPIAKAGSWHDVSWKPSVFFTTTRIGACEMFNNFIHERRGEYVLILVDPTKVDGTIRPDRDYDQGLWTATDVPSAAILGVEAVDEAFFESREFLQYMGIDDDGDEKD